MLIASVSTISLQETPKSRKQGLRRQKSDCPKKILFSGQDQRHQTKPNKHPYWTDAETSGLVQFLMLHTNGKHWVRHKNDRFWNQASVFIQLLGTSYKRSGKNYFYMAYFTKYIYLL